jgi:DNA gyrase/topoisomerase IV subunit A
MFGEEIVLEIDKTLDQLIRNAEVISTVDLKELSETEVEAFQKTQESLLHHLMSMDKALSAKAKTAQNKLLEKRQKFEKMKSSYSRSIAESAAHRPIICKRKAKRFFDLRSRNKVLIAR